MSRYTGRGWLLEFYDTDRPFVPVADVLGGVLPGGEDGAGVLAWTQANGARDGTPYVLRPDGSADVRISLVWRNLSVRGLEAAAQRRYAYSLKVWLNLLDRYGVEWDTVSVCEHHPNLLAEFKAQTGHLPNISAAQATHVQLNHVQQENARLRDVNALL